MPEHDYRSNDTLHWNPLLDCFTKRIISSRSSDTPQGPISNSKSLVIFHILPRALRAIESKDSMVHKMRITSPPVTTVRIHLTLKNAERWPIDWMSTGVEVRHATGVTIGHLLELWADREPNLERHMSLAAGLYIPPRFATDAEQDEMELRVSEAMNMEWNTAHGCTANTSSRVAGSEFVVPGLPIELVFN